MYQANSKVLSLSQLCQEVERKKAQGKRMVFTNGCFDFLHWGHVRYLEGARSLGDFLVVGINSDESVEGLKGPARPIFSQGHRAELIAALACVDYVTVFNEPTACQLIEALRPEVYVKGGDYKKVESLPEAGAVMKYGGEIKLLPGADEISTTQILEAIASGKGKL